MRLSVVRVYERGRKLTEHELRSAAGVVGDVRIQIVQKPDGRSVRQAICIALTTGALPPLFEPQLTGISTLALGLEGYEEAQTASGSGVLSPGVVVQNAVNPRPVTPWPT